jgi:predicted Fe-Mo cluster-binding NifX family protein
MKITVTHENDNVFQYFGHTKQFKVYTIENLKVVSSEVIATDKEGQSSISDFLEKIGTTVLICGGIREEAKKILTEKGIVVYSGADGNTDEVVQGFLDGSLFLKNEEGCSGKGGHLCGTCNRC